MPKLIKPGLKAEISQVAVDSIPVFSNPSLDLSYVKVVKVVLNEADIDKNLWSQLGYSQALYGIFYQPLYDTSLNVQCNTSNFAYCENANYRRIPLPGEIVSIHKYIRPDSSQETDMFLSTFSWTEIVPVWNVPEANYFIPSGSNQEYDESGIVINPLQLNPGDITLEGRHGQSIRFGGSYREGGLGSEETNNNPYIILRNGQGNETALGDEPIYEDINLDSSSIYLTTDQKVNLEEANSKRDSWKTDVPRPTSECSEPQLLLNSDRIIFNARNNDINILAKQNIALAGQRIGIDGEEFVSIDADKIYLGKKGQLENEPVLKGKTSVDWLSELCSLLKDLITTISSTTTEASLGALASEATSLLPQLDEVSSRLTSLLSEKTYTE